MTMRSALALACLLGVASLGLAYPAIAQQRDDVADLNARLFAAVRANDIATVRLVLTNGADPMAVDSTGQTAAGVAIDRGYFDIAHHILGVRNQRQALLRRENEEERNNAPLGTARASTASAPPTMATAAPQERKPDVTWRDKSVPGQPAEIPTARLSSPQEPVVITPASVSSGSRASAVAKGTPKAAAGKPAAPIASAIPAKPQPAAPLPQASLVNLPAMPVGAPNPFDPKSAEPEAPPVLSSAPAPKSGVGAQASAESERPRETSSGNPLSRFFNGITGVFGGGS